MAKGAHPSPWISEIYAFFGGGVGLPPPQKKRKRNVSPSWGKKPEYRPLLISLNYVLVLNHS